MHSKLLENNPLFKECIEVLNAIILSDQVDNYIIVFSCFLIYSVEVIWKSKNI